MKKFPSHSSSGLSLIEVVVFIAISSVILVVVVSLSINVTRQTYISHHKLYATRYADEFAEWLRIQKELSWQTFYDASQAGSRIYCMNDEISLQSTLSNLISGSGACPFYDGIRTAVPDTEPAIYAREVTFAEQLENTKSVMATITVKWKEANNTEYSTQLETYFAPR